MVTETVRSSVERTLLRDKVYIEFDRERAAAKVRRRLSLFDPPLQFDSKFGIKILRRTYN
jgi:hypothetical protein